MCPPCPKVGKRLKERHIFVSRLELLEPIPCDVVVNDKHLSLNNPFGKHPHSGLHSLLVRFTRASTLRIIMVAPDAWNSQSRVGMGLELQITGSEVVALSIRLSEPILQQSAAFRRLHVRSFIHFTKQ